MSALADEFRRLTRRAFLVNLGWGVEAIAGLLFVGYVARVIAPSDYGVLVFATSVAGLLALFDLGITGVLVPAFVRESVQRPAGALATLFSTSLAALWISGIVVLALSIGVAILGPNVLRSDAFASPHARLVLAIFGLMAALGLPSRAYELLFEAHARYGSLATARAISASVRLVASVWVVRMGHGVVAIAVVAATLAAARLLAFAVATRVLFPDIRSPARRDWSLLRQLARDARWAAVDNTARQIMMMSDAALLAIVAPVNAVALYGVASRVPLLAWNVAGKALGVSMQAASEHDAMGSRAGVRDVFQSTLALATTAVWPALVVLVVFAEPFLVTWAGPAYAPAATTMRWLLLAGMAFALGAAAHSVLYACRRVDVVAKITIVEGMANVALSLLLGFRLGAPGPAIATALTVTIAMTAFFIPAACRAIGMSVSRLARDLIGQTVLPLALVLAVAITLRRLLPADRPVLQCAAAFALALLCFVRLPLTIMGRSPRVTRRPPTPTPAPTPAVADAG